MIPIERDEQDRIICKCVTDELVVCTKSFPNKAQLDRHLKTVNPTFWTVCIYIYLVHHLCLIVTVGTN